MLLHVASCQLVVMDSGVPRTPPFGVPGKHERRTVRDQPGGGPRLFSDDNDSASDADAQISPLPNDCLREMPLSRPDWHRASGDFATQRVGVFQYRSPDLIESALASTSASVRSVTRCSRVSFNSCSCT